MFRSETQIVAKNPLCIILNFRLMKWTLDVFATIFVSLRNIKRSFYESRNWSFAWANWWFDIKTDIFLCFLCHNWSVLMWNHQLSHAKHQFCDSWNERLMFRRKTKIVAKIHSWFLGSLYQATQLGSLYRATQVLSKKYQKWQQKSNVGCKKPIVKNIRDEYNFIILRNLGVFSCATLLLIRDFALETFTNTKLVKMEKSVTR